MVAALVLGSCAPAVTEEEEEEVVTPKEEEKEEEKKDEVTEEEEEPAVTGPQYGGTLVYGFRTDPSAWDERYHGLWYANALQLSNEPLLIGDWAKGTRGTGVTGFIYNMFPWPAYMTGCLAESWEITGADTMEFDIRQGVYFQDKPPANGRQMDAYDIEYSLLRLYKYSTSYQYTAYDWERHGERIEATDKWHLIVEAKPGMMTRFYDCMVGAMAVVVPKEIDDYFEDGMKQWENVVGTGPFYLADYVSGSSITWERNPNYWMKDPFAPENQLPYLDKVRRLILSDVSTFVAAMRTRKVDIINGRFHADFKWEEAQDLIATNPEMGSRNYPPGNFSGVALRVDNPELPWYDKKVRIALGMAFNNEAMKDSFYDGNAEILNWPVMNIPAFANIYNSLDELPEETRMIFEYHPDRAKELLTEAGYPDGFKVEVVCEAPTVDMLSIIKADWAKVGVEMTLSVKEHAAYLSICGNKSYQEGVTYGFQPVTPEKMNRIVSGQYFNYPMINDPKIDEAWVDVTANVMTDYDKVVAIEKDLFAHVLNQAYATIIPPAPYVYGVWQPWVGGYNGEIFVGKWSHYMGFPRYVWIEKAIKDQYTK